MVAHGKHSSGDTVYTVTYDSSSEIGVLFQMWGSVWPKVRRGVNASLLVVCDFRWEENTPDGPRGVWKEEVICLRKRQMPPTRC